ncbi:MAG TPA: TadE family protein [Acetobacteraceae bacterium]|nr:TadE family protein [Acetobacteraceae bacterium]
MKSRGQRGATSVEFAIIGLVFMSLLMLALDVGWQLVVDSALGVGARAAARFGTTGVAVAPGITPAPSSRTDSIFDLVILNSGNLLRADRLQIAATSYASFAAIGGGGTAGPGNAGQVVRYTFSYTQPYLTPIAMTITGASQVVHTLQLVVQNEPFPEN